MIRAEATVNIPSTTVEWKGHVFFFLPHPRKFAAQNIDFRLNHDDPT